MVLWTLVHRFLYEHVFSWIYKRVELLGHIVTLFNFLRHCQMVFQSNCTILHSTSDVWGVQLLHMLCKSFLFHIALTTAWHPIHLLLSGSSIRRQALRNGAFLSCFPLYPQHHTQCLAQSAALSINICWIREYSSLNFFHLIPLIRMLTFSYLSNKWTHFSCKNFKTL